MKLPEEYKWLEKLSPLPLTIQEGLKLLGVAEVVGKGSSRTIVNWRDELNQSGIPISGFSDDDIPWCGLFAAIVAKRAGKRVVEGPLWAMNWMKFGNPAMKAMLGDCLVFKRKGGGHVGWYIAEDNTAYHVLGGNQGNKVSIARIAKARCVGIRRPFYSVMPSTVRRYWITDLKDGKLSQNEA